MKKGNSNDSIVICPAAKNRHPQRCRWLGEKRSLPIVRGSIACRSLVSRREGAKNRTWVMPWMILISGNRRGDAEREKMVFSEFSSASYSSHSADGIKLDDVDGVKEGEAINFQSGIDFKRRSPLWMTRWSLCAFDVLPAKVTGRCLDFSWFCN